MTRPPGINRGDEGSITMQAVLSVSLDSDVGEMMMMMISFTSQFIVGVLCVDE